MSVLLAVLVVFAVLVVALTVPVAIRDRRRAPAAYPGQRGRRAGGSSYGHPDGVTVFGAGLGGGVDGGGCGSGATVGAAERIR